WLQQCDAEISVKACPRWLSITSIDPAAFGEYSPPFAVRVSSSQVRQGRTRRGELCTDLFQSRGEGFNLLLQPGNRRALFLPRLVLFEKFVQQHCVHRVVADGVRFSFLVTHH